MACDCINVVNQKLGPEHELKITIIFDANVNMEARPAMDILRRDNGRPETRRGKHSKMIPTFCPFCGVRYEPAPAEPRS